MNKSILIALIALVLLIIVAVYFAGHKKEHSLIFKTPSGKTATVTVE